LRPSGIETSEPPLPASRQRGRLLWSEVPSINKCSLAAFAERARHHSHSFAAASWLPTLFRSHLCFRIRGARPSTVVTGYSPVIVRTTRCLSTSAIVTIPEHNRSIDQTPFGMPESPRSYHYGDWSPLSEPRPAEDSQIRGRRGEPTVDLSALRSLAEGASPQPDRLGHLLSQTCFRRRLESPPLVNEPSLRRATSAGSPAGSRLREAQRLGPPHAHPREGIHDPPHPRCLPSIGPPPKECARTHLTPSVTRGEIATSWRLFFHRICPSP